MHSGADVKGRQSPAENGSTLVKSTSFKTAETALKKTQCWQVVQKNEARPPSFTCLIGAEHLGQDLPFLP